MRSNGPPRFWSEAGNRQKEGIPTALSDSHRKAYTDQAARDDAETIRRTLAGDRNAFEAIVRRHHTDLLRLLCSVTRNWEDAEDMSQEAFLRAFRALDRFDLERPFRPWLWTIGIRLALQRIARKDHKNLSLETASTDSDEDRRREGRWTTDPLALEKVESQVAQIDIFRALESLDPSYRAVIVLRALGDRTYEEIAEVLGIPEGTVMSRLSRARAQLRVKLEGNRPRGDQDG